ncbi:MAG: peptidoglycan D,D-transpeptidase FtsI family protein [Armatimonadota bacterium]
MSIPRRNEFTLVRKRMEGVFILFILGLILLVARLVDLQVLKGPGFERLATRMHVRTRTIDAARGMVLDRNGSELARDVLSKHVAMNPRILESPAATAARLASLLKLDEKQQEAIRKRLAVGAKKRRAYSQVLRNLDRKVAEDLYEKSRKDPLLEGLWLEDAPLRVYPSGRDGTQIVGPVSSDGRGIEGIELKFDSVLRGHDGQRVVRVDAAGKVIPESEQIRSHPVDGANVKLTIDRDIQHFVEAELLKVAEAQEPDAATAVVMDVRNGDVLAMANWPSYHPDDKKITPAQRRNRAVTDLFEPGSIFKVITAAAAMEAGVKLDATCTGGRQIGRYRVRCAHGANHGHVPISEMVTVSCNLAAGALAERVGPAGMYDYMDKFGLNQKTGIEFPGEAYWPHDKPDTWKTIRTVNVGFGQGVNISPIQLVAAYAAIGNDGVYNPPRLVLEAPGAKLPPRESRRVMSAENARKLRSYMESVVVGAGGTGKNAKIAGYTVGGKTGTAQIAMNGRYGSGYVASFAGFVPAREPRLAILVSVWHPRHGQYGGAVSAPVFREIARQSVAFLKIPPDAPTDHRDGADPASFYRKVAAAEESYD